MSLRSISLACGLSLVAATLAVAVPPAASQTAVPGTRVPGAPEYPIAPVIGETNPPLATAPPEADASPAAAGSADPAASGAPAGAPQADPTSKAPNTYGNDAPPPRLNISSPAKDDTATFRIEGALLARPQFVSFRALGLYRHEPISTASGSYAGVALHFLPGIESLVHPNAAGGDALIALSPATISVVGREGDRATFRSSELIDAQGFPRVFVCDHRNGVAIAGDEGPFRLIVPSDRTRSRWVRDVVEIDVTH